MGSKRRPDCPGQLVAHTFGFIGHELGQVRVLTCQCACWDKSLIMGPFGQMHDALAVRLANK